MQICAVAFLNVFLLCGIASFAQSDMVIADGQMPAVAADSKGNINVVYGHGDSILHVQSSDGGIKFSQPVLVSLLPGLAASFSRGPQIALADEGLVVVACTKDGDIYSYRNTSANKWLPAVRVNDVDTVAKEGLMGFSADGKLAYLVWLDLRNGHNEIFGSRSVDGGKSWSTNKQVYRSPDTTVCECCKPSVAVSGGQVNVMFRNWLQGKRDLYLVQSADRGNTFGSAHKLGMGSWALDGCPMDGGGLAVQEHHAIETVWRREGKIYGAQPGKAETVIGEGKGCVITIVGGRPAYAWTNKADVVALLPDAGQIKIGEGVFPVIAAAGDNKVVCVWENTKQIHARVVSLPK